ncbi:MAG: OsmC family protein [Candidatus Freyarchaeota archaeon]|nr:OsmC family protein [Candidatus Freyrarchaeum guaymaensis]
MGRGKLKVFEVDLRWLRDFLFEVKVADFSEFYMDELEPEGHDSAPNPADYLLVSIGGCTASSFVYAARKFGVPIEKVNVKVRGRYVRKKGMVRIGLVDVEVEAFHSSMSEEDLENLEWCIKVFRKYCVISESLREGLPIHVTLKVNGETIEVPTPEE